LARVLDTVLYGQYRADSTGLVLLVELFDEDELDSAQFLVLDDG